MATQDNQDNAVNNEDVLERLKQMGLLGQPAQPAATPTPGPAFPVSVSAGPAPVRAPAYGDPGEPVLPEMRPLGPPAGPKPLTPEYYQQKQAAEDQKKLQHPATTLGRIGQTIGNVLRPIGEHLTEPREIREANKNRNLTGFIESSKAQEEQALAKKAAEPGNKYAFHYQDDNGNVFGVKQDGTIENITEEGAAQGVKGAKGKETQAKAPKITLVKDIQGPNGPQSGFVDENDRFVTEEDVKNGYPASSLGDMKFTGTVQTTPKNQGKGTYKMVPDADGKNEQLQYFPPDDPTKGQPIGGKAPIGTNTPLLDPQGNIKGLFNNKTNAITPVAAAAGGETTVPEGATTSSGARLKNTEANQFSTEYRNPTLTTEQAYQKFQQAYDDYKAGTKTGAASMVALSQHLATTFGSVKGSRMTKDLIAEHKDAIGQIDKIERYGAQLASGQQLAPDQWEEFGKLIKNTRDLSWEFTAKEALRTKQPLPELPADVGVVVKSKKTGQMGRKFPDGTVLPMEQ